jgi:hypothetical protein
MLFGERILSCCFLRYFGGRHRVRTCDPCRVKESPEAGRVESYCKVRAISTQKPIVTPEVVPQSRIPAQAEQSQRQSHIGALNHSSAAVNVTIAYRSPAPKFWTQ